MTNVAAGDIIKTEKQEPTIINNLIAAAIYFYVKKQREFLVAFIVFAGRKNRLTFSLFTVTFYFKIDKFK